ncbi:MAG TPA: oxidoreductase, partial [Actinobacteria bacterium]|nr:oxidoreductase [Actinomycetota bacterium]
MDLELRDKTVVITGASSGLGLATALSAASEGASLILNSRDAQRLTTAAQDAEAAGATLVKTVTGSLGEAHTATDIVQAAMDATGRLDAVAISIGGPPAGPDGSISDEQWHEAFTTVFMGMRRMARTAAQVMGPGGSIVLVLSSTVRVPIAGIATSNGLRPGLAVLAKQMSVEFGPQGIRVNCVLPGRFDTARVRSLDAVHDDPQAA